MGDENLEDLIRDFHFTKDIEKDFYKFLVFHDLEDVAHHSYMVANKAAELARDFDLDMEAALIAGYLHDIGRVPRDEKKIDFAKKFNIMLLPAEEKFPDILHQKISRVMAAELFNIIDENILHAIECHSTLRAGAKGLDLVLFAADKLQWDSSDNKEFKKAMQEGLEKSLEHGAFANIKYNYDNKEKLTVIHPWTIEAYNDLSKRCNVL
jgi:predicted HD superfamily hydrolase involved in NAD metabolism